MVSNRKYKKSSRLFSQSETFGNNMIMKTNLPTAPGPYWWRESARDEWEHVYVRETSSIPGYEFTVLFPNSGMEVDLPDMQGQWAKVYQPDEGIEAWGVFNNAKNMQVSARTEEAVWNLTEVFLHTGDWGPDKGDLLEAGYTCEPVTIYRKATR